MGWWKADPVPDEPRPQAQSAQHGQSLPTSPPSQLPQSTISSSMSDNASACPVDPKTRQIWLQQAQQKAQPGQKMPSPSSPQTQSTSSLPQNHPRLPQMSAANETFTAAPSEQCSSDRIDQSPISSPRPVVKNVRPLSNDREISTIPRAYPTMNKTGDEANQHGAVASSVPSNAESETGHDKQSGNWIYPSETQFFNAVMRKGSTQTTTAADLANSVSSIIPIHNAVNERAWTMIRKWESPQPANTSCNGPKLLRFEGKGAGAKSPRAIMKSWGGYSEPFDRHDWTIQRCDGTEVEYVIDFYQGRSPAGQVSGATQGAPATGMGGLNFYLDVRPKLNTFEGCRMRIAHVFGLS